MGVLVQEVRLQDCVHVEHAITARLVQSYNLLKTGLTSGDALGNGCAI